MRILPSVSVLELVLSTLSLDLIDMFSWLTAITNWNQILKHSWFLVWKLTQLLTCICLLWKTLLWSIHVFVFILWDATNFICCRITVGTSENCKEGETNWMERKRKEWGTKVRNEPQATTIFCPRKEKVKNVAQIKEETLMMGIPRRLEYIFFLFDSFSISWKSLT